MYIESDLYLYHSSIRIVEPREKKVVYQGSWGDISADLGLVSSEVDRSKSKSASSSETGRLFVRRMRRDGGFVSARFQEERGLEAAETGGFEGEIEEEEAEEEGD